MRRSRMTDVDRLHPEGIRRGDLTFALSRRLSVETARRVNRCLLCRRSDVNEAGVCQFCMPLLSESELRLVDRWLTGQGP